MSEAPREPRPAQPLTGYRDIGADEEHESRRSVIRTWVILVVIAFFYLAWTLTVYFLEPGLR